MLTASPIEARSPNWLPLPGAQPAPPSEEAPIVDENDLFPKGRVEAFYPRQGEGMVLNDRGERIPFRVAEIDLIGPKGNARYIAAGARVGYDVSCTSHGRRVSRIKVY